MRRILLATAIVAASAGALALRFGRASAVEEPPYKLIARWGACELREYPELIVAETRIGDSRGGGESKAFRSLAGFIFGANAGAEKIAMTAPVLETPGDEGWTMRFTLPQGRRSAPPAPNDANVKTRRVPPARVAAIRFSGWASDADLAAKARELEACLKAQGLTPAGPAALAQYDPPWILGPWRRNEAMIPAQ